MAWQWHQLNHIQIICTSLQADNHVSASFFTGWMLFLTLNQQCQSTEGDFKLLATRGLCSIVYNDSPDDWSMSWL